MAKRSPRLQFTEEELTDPAISKSAEKAGKAADKLEKAEKKIPRKKAKQRVVSSDGKVTTRLIFEEKKQPSKLAYTARDAPLDTVRGTIHREIRESGDDNAGTDAANSISEAAESSYRIAETAHHSHVQKPYREANRAEAAADKSNIRALEKEYEKTQSYSANPYSKWQQKRAIKKEYAAAKAGKGADNTVKASETAAKAAKSSAEKAKKTSEFVARNKKAFLIIGGIAALILLMTSVFSSCSVIFEGLSSTVVSTTYPAEDSDMLAAEAAYCAMEEELQEYLDNYESTHDYDEYQYELDDIQHDPYVLISAITALQGGEWMIDEIGDTLQTLFDKQYILTETVTTETRYRTERRTGYRTVTDPETGETSERRYTYTVSVPYTYYICTVKLENFNLSHVPVYIMSQDQLSMYSMYMSTLGNRPDLFADSSYVSKYYNTEYEKYEIPADALEDEQFALMIAEAEKYLGYPYVWGGSSPSTSFDCSGFVSYVCNNCGVGWNFGRLGAEGLRNICTRVSSSNVKPGDLVFFQGTYDTVGASHVGIYVGNGMMIHCGDPIQYASLNTSYWQAHFLSYGRLPSP